MVSKGQFVGLDWNCIFSSCFQFMFCYERWNAVLKQTTVEALTMKISEELIKK